MEFIVSVKSKTTMVIISHTSFHKYIVLIMELLEHKSTIQN